MHGCITWTACHHSIKLRSICASLSNSMPALHSLMEPGKSTNRSTTDHVNDPGTFSLTWNCKRVGTEIEVLSILSQDWVLVASGFYPVGQLNYPHLSLSFSLSLSHAHIRTHMFSNDITCCYSQLIQTTNLPWINKEQVHIPYMTCKDPEAMTWITRQTT